MGKIAFLFPGQGSQVVGMGKDMIEKHDEAATIFKKADERLGYSLTEIIFDGPQEMLTRTENAQPALLTTSVAILEVLKKSGITPHYTAGHSLGEYSALVASESLSFEDAVYAVRKRGELMEEAVPAGIGTMAAVLGMDADLLREVTEEASNSDEVVQLANLNCPGQIVISGNRVAVERAAELAKEKGAKRVIPLVVSGPFHSSLMKPAASNFSSVLDEISVSEAKVPVIGNVTAKPMTDAEEIKAKLIEQLYSPVRWQETIELLLEEGVDTFIEIGPGKVLSGLVRKVQRRVNTYNIEDSETLLKTIEKLRGDE
ncbi:ACP S-malonyltransferase [Bacillus solimangrovi]|uniref:Malonyl CoA-acyl carrier protein transacylase n=1 Tax=Bacillus solimangrovi TaxID=1305675 RepID=A0A1E5LAV6_9BACI|nr:ACP S-malonyltransferase [Bacillus solimangrovi]OEH91228.1 [acyl-carrier-protein] S-malonyltransferase [Bacillus solimangrovi]